MTLDERVIWLLLGMVIGYFLSYLTRTLQDILKGVNEMDEFIKDNPPRKRDESGAVNQNSIRNFALLFVVLLTAFAAFQSQVASNKADENQDQLEKVVTCVIVNQTAFLDAINTRTSYTREQAQANKKLQEAQKVFFGVLLHIPPYTEARRDKAARAYQDALDVFLDAANASEDNATTTKYPMAEELLTCVREKKKE